MLTALYYPHVTMKPSLAKNALFLWDRIEYIAPYDGFKPPYKDSELGEVVQAFAVPRIPTNDEKRLVDDTITDLIKSGLPDWFYVQKVPQRRRYDLYPEKLMRDTWKKLERHSLAQGMQECFETSAPLGLSIMSILADCLLARLVELREKEKTPKGAQLRDLRHSYLKKVEEYADKLAKAKSKKDTEEIERIIAPTVGPLLAGGALYLKKIEYRAARNKALKSHPMSWLYSMRRFPLF